MRFSVPPMNFLKHQRSQVTTTGTSRAIQFNGPFFIPKGTKRVKHATHPRHQSTNGDHCWFGAFVGLGFESGYTQGCQSLSCRGIPGIWATKILKKRNVYIISEDLESPFGEPTPSKTRIYQACQQKIFNSQFILLL